MPREDASTLSPAQGLLGAVRNPTASMRRKYRDDPVGLAERLGLKLPKKPVLVMIAKGIITEAEARERFGVVTKGLREFVEEVCKGEVRSAVAVANRGGGKSNGVSFIEFFLVFIKDYDALNLAGSELQADGVYQYILSYIDTHEEFRQMVKGDTLQSKTETVYNAWIRVLTASQKSVRSPHAGGRKKDGRQAGGILVIDEEAEADPKIVEAALPTINTARPSVNARVSTFHNVEGTFADVVENHEEMGYELYSWDIFDVCEGCDCGPDRCESPEPCFREDHYEDAVNTETNQIERKLIHKAYCGGRARYADGWIPMVEVETLWRRMKRNHATWEVEAMGSRPGVSGHVLRDRKKYAEAITEEPAASLYVPGMPIEVCIDWGTVAAGIVVWQRQHLFNKHVLLHAEPVENAGGSHILGIALGYAMRYKAEFTTFAADIGGGGNYMNRKLRDEMGYPVRDMNFGEEKESAAAVWNILQEAGETVLPAEFTEFHDQARKWKRDKGNRIKKGNDHLMDASLCYFASMIDDVGVRHLRVLPRSFTTGVGTSHDAVAPVSNMPVRQGSSGPPRVALIRGIGRRR